MTITPNSWGATPLRESMRDQLVRRFGIERFEHAPRHANLPPDPRKLIPKTIGYAPRTREWYGWSHRAVAGFKVGSTVKAGDVLADETDNGGRSRRYPVGYTARTEDDAKQMAADFAGAVS